MNHHYFYPLTNVVKNYPWGSRSAMSQRFNILNPDALPQAELWMGVHPSGISQVNSQGVPMALSELIARDKTAMLGDDTVKRFGDLPYLLKILAAESALSIQVHPKKAQAEAGFARTAPSPSSEIPDYNDANHKPELVYAITSFIAMNGFRAINSIVENFKALDIPPLNEAANKLALHPDAEGLRAFFVALMQISPANKEQAIQRLSSGNISLYDEALVNIVQRLKQHYPNDIGVLAPLYLNCVTLQPGEAMFLYPGTLHAYIHGTAIEVMASSDNVLRAGLTNKKINLEELVCCTTFEPADQATLLMLPERQDGQARYPIPVDDFRFSIFTATVDYQLQTRSAEILLVIDGAATLKHINGEMLRLETGQSAFIPASTGDWSLTTTGKLCRVSC
ncbi:mannose-6-phosphate isomerase, class I [Pantoea sp. B65]|uniref:mannose-6-phosphate isomerase, class I n=1 Tax=Pantoea sp. B65 TaxID=2813359 RepID=UPI0039B65D41